ncbi:MAG: hypothetical protein JXB39_01520 [Deltaproteobacteria bacterium]|nr:hypothetical protein [Deltaproteobacteria bacterium]
MEPPDLEVAAGAVPLGILAVSDLEPAVGETVRITAPYAGPWPVDLGWRGVDADRGITAHVVPSVPGPHEVSAGGIRTVLQVQAAANRWIPSVEVDLRPLPALAAPCKDRRYPRLVGHWAVGCGVEGWVDRLVDLATREVIVLDGGGRTPGVGTPGMLLALDERPARLWTLPAQVHASIPNPCAHPPVAPPALAGNEVAITTRHRVVRFRAGEAVARLQGADPLPWYPPALAGGFMAWVDGREREVTGTDVWAWDGGGKPVPVAREPGDQRHVAGSGHWLGWIDDRGVVVEDLVSGERSTVRAASGFRAGLTLWGPVACWEDRAGGSVDVACSDGLTIRGDQDQGWPSRWGPWLLLRVDGEVRLATARSLVLEDDDPRARPTAPRVAGGHGGAHRQGEVVWTFDWPAAGWCVDRWEADSTQGRWAPAGPLAVGEDVEVRHPGGDAVRLRPCGSEDA